MIRPQAARRAARRPPAARWPQCAVKWDRNLKPKLAIMRQYTSVTDRRTDGYWHHSISLGLLSCTNSAVDSLVSHCLTNCVRRRLYRPRPSLQATVSQSTAASARAHERKLITMQISVFVQIIQMQRLWKWQ